MKNLNSLRAILVGGLAWSIATFICISVAIVISNKFNIGQLLSPVITILLCRWLWNGSPVSRAVAVGLSSLTILVLFVILLNVEFVPIFPVAVASFSLILWSWIALELMFSKTVSSERKNHWNSVRENQQITSFMTVLKPGLILGIMVSLIVIGGFRIERYYRFERFTQQWLNDLASEVSKQAPSKISEYLTFTGAKSTNFNFIFQYEFNLPTEFNTTSELRKQLEAESLSTDCNKDFVKQLIRSDIAISRQYTEKSTGVIFEFSVNTVCGEEKLVF